MSKTHAVLLVEDDDDDVAGLEDMARHSGRWHIAARATSLAAAQAHLAGAEPPFDVCLLDLHVDGSQGIEEFITQSKIPIVVLTAHDDAVIGREVIAAGAEDYILKSELHAPLVGRVLGHAVERFALRRQLEERAAGLEHFASMAAHDIRAPLRQMRIFSDLLLEEYAEHLDREGVEWLSHINAASLRLSTLIQDLLQYARGGGKPEPMWVELEPLLDEVRVDLRADLSESDGVLRHEGELPAIYADRTQVLLVLENLVANALKFRRAAPPEVVVRVVDEADHWRIEVEDNGIGIEPAQHERIFQPFTRLHSPQAYAGSGLGLATCMRVVAEHGGMMGLVSRVEQGSVFWLTWPKPQSSRSS